MFNIQVWVFQRNILSTFQFNDVFQTVIMLNNVTGCVISKSNKIEYFEKKDSSKNLSKKLYCDFN